MERLSVRAIARSFAICSGVALGMFTGASVAEVAA